MVVENELSPAVCPFECLEGMTNTNNTAASERCPTLLSHHKSVLPPADRIRRTLHGSFYFPQPPFTPHTCA